MDPLLGNDRETNNETTVIAKQQLRKYATLLEPFLGSGPRNNGNTAGSCVFCVVPSEAVSLDRPISVQLVQCGGVERVVSRVS
jgi:hypothetical protein